MKRSHLRLALGSLAVFCFAGSAVAQSVALPPVISKAFGAAVIGVGGTTSVTVTITNPNAGSALAGVSFTDTLPAGLGFATPSALASTCGGVAVAASGPPATLSTTGGTLAAGATCTVSANVVGLVLGTDVNTVTVSSTPEGLGNTATATVVVAAAPTISKAFGAPLIGVGATTSLTFTINNPNPAVGLTGISFTDPLPAGLAFASPSGLAANCGGVAVAATGPPATVSLTAGALAAGASCMVSVNVKGISVGTQINSVTVASTSTGTGNTSNASLIVVQGAPYLRGSNMIGRGTQAGVITFDPGPADSFKR